MPGRTTKAKVTPPAGLTEATNDKKRKKKKSEETRLSKEVAHALLVSQHERLFRALSYMQVADRRDKK